jgi:hypothetical protein
VINEIQYLYPNADFSISGNVNVGLVNSTLTITYWNTSVLGPQPTPAALSAVTTVANTASSWALCRQAALQALRASDVTIIRCVETVPTAVPTAWDIYRQQLRAIVSAATGDPTQPLPTAPVAPTGS